MIKEDGLDRAWQAPATGDPEAESSAGSIAVLSGQALTLWSSGSLREDRRQEYALELAPDRPVVVGRNEGHAPDYLDPNYAPTRIMPGTGQNILHAEGRGPDRYVSRGHFMLRAMTGGIVFVNGVPRRGGGLRPPVNGTWLLHPANRSMDPGEEYRIEAGSGIVVCLPNGSHLRIEAN